MNFLRQCSKLLLRAPAGGRSYHKNVIEHYNNPRNVGTLDKTKSNVGTGLVGAPACIHEDTHIAVVDDRNSVSIKTLYLENKQVSVWSYNKTHIRT